MIEIHANYVELLLMTNDKIISTSDGATLPPLPIVVPFPQWDDWVAECIEGCAKLDYPDFEIWLLPDEPLPADRIAEANRLAGGRTVRVLPTGPANPAKKRNVALRASNHAWAALIDADAFPRSDWLKNAFREASSDVAIIAGPNITPPNDPLSRQISGLAMRSPLGFGAGYIRHHPVAKHDAEEMPTCNMIIRRLPDLYFREEFSTAEDMMYCRDARNRGFRIVYTPDVVVYHHRRTFPSAFARQFYFYGRDKGRLFVQSHGVGRIGHAAPAGLLLYASATILLALFWKVPLWWWIPALAYALLVAVESLRCARSPLLALCGLIAFPVAHISYGFGFWRGIPKGLRERRDTSADNCSRGR